MKDKKPDQMWALLTVTSILHTCHATGPSSLVWCAVVCHGFINIWTIYSLSDFTFALSCWKKYIYVHNWLHCSVLYFLITWYCYWYLIDTWYILSSSFLIKYFPSFFLSCFFFFFYLSMFFISFKYLMINPLSKGKSCCCSCFYMTTTCMLTKISSVTLH